uniref:SH3 domain-containing protein n=1 Tax=Mucochytrium quahogii TaxID=96639 RepID=A0A7S2S4P7_9STRA|mmetsp:Transcript_24757/g.53407  ORF Transcript_24757/g.53407 Transcript_24757/m.53407 type:complete len:193 (+) Transcript_24757:171-749(+)
MLFLVKYTFSAQDQGELSVQKGDIVRVNNQSQQLSKDGWTLVETVHQPFLKGYVPTNYITPAETKTNPKNRPPVRRLSDPRLPAQLLEKLEEPTECDESPKKPIVAKQQPQVDLSRIFDKHDSAFEKIMAAISSIETTHIHRQVQTQQEKNKNIIHTINQIQQQLDKQRQALEIRIQHDNESINNRLAQLYA